MSTRRRQIAATLAGAAVLAPGPAAASAAPTPVKAPAHTRGAAAQRPGSARGSSGSLATRLGVSDRALRRALEEGRAELAPPSSPDDRHESDLAAGLGVTRAEAVSALERLRRRHDGRASAMPGRLADELARELGIDADRVTLALRDLGARGTRRAVGRRAQYAAAVARRLGLPAEHVESALPPVLA